MKIKLILMAAAAVIAADAHAMIRAGRVKVTRPAVQANVTRMAIMPRLNFKAQGIPQITKEALDLKVKNQELQARALKQAELTRNVEKADSKLRNAKERMILGATATAGLLALPATIEYLDPSFVGEAASLILNITNIATVPLAAGFALANWYCMEKAATHKMNAEQALETFVKEQKAEASFVPDIK